MTSNCEECGKKLQYPILTHCSNQCLFLQLKNSKSIGENPIETWDDEDPWI